MMKDMYTAFSESKMSGGRVINSTLFTKDFNFALDNKLSNIVFGVSEECHDPTNIPHAKKPKTLKNKQKNNKNQMSKSKRNNKSRRSKDI